MRISKVITAIDTHTQGEPTRIVTGGLPFIPGKNMQDKKSWMAQHQDHIRKMLMWEPRGHRDMFGAVITQPILEDADAGVLFMDCDGYLDMCGHGSIGAVTVLLETGIIKHGSPGEQNQKKVTIDTPAGRVLANARIEDGRVTQISVKNVPSFYYASTHMKVGNLGEIPVHVAYGGNFFALVDIRHLNLDLEPAALPRLIQIGLEIKETVNDLVNIVHPGTGKSGEVGLVEIYEESDPPKNVVIFGNGQVDRSPCGTGTCAKMAMLHAQKKLEVGRPYKYRSILGTEFTGRIVEETKVGEYDAVVPEITGRAYITGILQLMVDDEDPFKHGFQLPTIS